MAFLFTVRYRNTLDFKASIYWDRKMTRFFIFMSLCIFSFIRCVSVQWVEVSCSGGIEQVEILHLTPLSRACMVALWRHAVYYEQTQWKPVWWVFLLKFRLIHFPKIEVSDLMHKQKKKNNKSRLWVYFHVMWPIEWVCSSMCSCDRFWPMGLKAVQYVVTS